MCSIRAPHTDALSRPCRVHCCCRASCMHTAYASNGRCHQRVVRTPSNVLSALSRSLSLSRLLIIVAGLLASSAGSFPRRCFSWPHRCGDTIKWSASDSKAFHSEQSRRPQRYFILESESEREREREIDGGATSRWMALLRCCTKYHCINACLHTLGFQCTLTAMRAMSVVV